MDPLENTDCELDALELPAAKKICLDNNDVSSSFRNESSLSDSTLHLGSLFSPRQSLGSCSINGRVDNNTFSSPIHRNITIDENKDINADVNKAFDKFEMDDNSKMCTVMPDLNGANECVKIAEIDQNSAFLSKLSSSHLSTKAFDIDKSLDFMDETCVDSHLDDYAEGKLVSVEAEENVKVDETTCIHNVENSINEDNINFTKKSDSNFSNKVEVTPDYKPDEMGEEKFVLCHSNIKKDAMSLSGKFCSDASLTSMSIDESLVSDLNNIPCQPMQVTSSDLMLIKPSMGMMNFEDSDCEKICDNSNSTNLYEVSGCALDYTCSKSVAFEGNDTLTENPSMKVSETSISVELECDEQDTNRPNSVMIGCDEQQKEVNLNSELNKCLKVEENSLSDTQNPVHDVYDISDLKNSFISNKTFSAEEVNFLKENLLKVMELLRNDNNSFESYKLASENEKRELLDKIRSLESNSTIGHESCAAISTSQEIGVEGKIDETRNYNITYEELSKLQRQYNNLLQLVLVTEANWMDNELFTNFLSDLNLAHNELFIPITEGSEEYVINHKKIYTIMQSLSKEIAKSNLFKEECINILKTYESSNTGKNRLQITAKPIEDNLVVNLKATFEEILNSKNYLEKENFELKMEVCNKSDEIRMLSSIIENLNQQLNNAKEIDVSTNPNVESRCNMLEATHNISRELTEKSNIHGSFDESYTNVIDMKESLATLKKTLSLNEEKYSNVALKCEKYEVELQKMREVEQVYQELLTHHNDLKTEIDSKCCELERLNAENQNLIDQIDELKCKYVISGTEDDKTNLMSMLETTPNSLIELGDKQNEIVISHDESIKDISFKNDGIVLLPNGEENLNKEFEIIQNDLSIKDNLVDLKENCDCSEVKVLMKDEISKLKLELYSLNEKYSETLSNFDNYKQIFTCTENECILWKEEKQSLECVLSSLKSQLDGALEESSKLKSVNEDISNKINSLMNQLSDLETTNTNLKTQLSGINNDSNRGLDLLNNEISELKVKLDSAEKLLMEHEKKHSELKVSYDKVCEELESKAEELSSLTDSKEVLVKELEIFSQNDTLLKQKIVELQEDRTTLETQLLSLKDEVSKLQLDLNSMKEKYCETVSDFSIYKERFTRTEDECLLLNEEKQSLEFELNSLKAELENGLEESSKLKLDKEEIENHLKNIENQLDEEKLCSKGIKDSYENLKTKYEDAVVEIENKAIEIHSLLTQITDLETTHTDLKNKLSGTHGDSENSLDLLSNEISEVKIKLSSAEKLVLDYEQKYNELKVSYDNVCKDLESKNADLSVLTDNKEKLEKELEILSQNDKLLKQKVEELQEDRTSLETPLLTSKDEVSKLQYDFNCLNEKYSEILSNFDAYKQKYTFTEDESSLWKEEKQSLECQLNSLKSELENALEETSKLKSDKEEINNNLKNLEEQLDEAKMSSKDMKDSFEDMKTKYEDSVVEINNKTVEVQCLLAQLLELETINGNLKNELSSLHSDSDQKIDLLNNEIKELKIKIDSAEKLLMEHEKKNSELKISYDKVCEELESKAAEISLLTDSKEVLIKELEIFSQNDKLLKQKVEELQDDRTSLETQLLSSNNEVSKLQLDLNSLKEKYSEILSNFDAYKQKYTFTEDESSLWKEEKRSLECQLNSLKSELENALEESSKLKSDKEEINNNLKNLEDQLDEAKISSKDMKDSFEDMKTKYEDSVIEIRNKAIELQNLLAQLSDLETSNANLKTELTNYCNNADINVNLLNNEINDVNIKLVSAEKLVLEYEQKYNELNISYDNVCKDLESKNADLSVLTDNKEKMEKELEILSQNDKLLKQKVEELQEDCTSLEIQLLSSKEEVSKLQLDFNSLNEKYSEILSNFDAYKQKYTFSEDESSLWKEEKRSLECQLNSLKSELENALEESSKLKSDKEEINNNLKNLEDQLDEAKLSSKDMKDSFEDMKTKYEDSVVEINNKTIEVQSLRAQLLELETTNGKLKNELSSLHCDSDQKIVLLNNDIKELKIKIDSAEKLLMEHEEKHSELKVSYDKVCEELESKAAELSSLTDSKEVLVKELEIFSQNDTLLKQKVVELQEDRTALETQLLSSKDEVSNLQLDLNSLKEKYSETVSDFSIYKERFTHTEDEFLLLNEEKQSLEFELSSLKYKLECALEELKKLKSDYEENNKNLKNIENQLCDEKKTCRDFQSSFENLKIKYEESVSIIDCKSLEIQNLLGQLSDLETSNANLKSELNVIRSDSEYNVNLLKKEILEMKGKYEESNKSLVDLEEKHSELKVSYNQICEDFASKMAEFSLLTDCKEQLEKEIDKLNQNNLSLKQKLIDLETSEEYHKKSMCDLNIQLDSANSKIDCMKKIEMQISVLKDEYDILSLYFTQDKEIPDEQPFCFFIEFVNAVEAVIKDLISFKTKCSEEEMKLLSSQEEVSRLNILLDSLKEEIKLSAEESGKLQDNYSSLSKQYNSLLDSSKDSNIRCNSLLEKLKELESQNCLCKSTIQDLKSEITAKDSIIASLSNIKEMYESTAKENESLSSQLMVKVKEYETALGKLKNSEDNYLSLELEYKTLINEINDLRNKNETLEMKCSENYSLYLSGKDSIEILQKEKEEIRKNFIKCEKDYQNSLDLVQKCQENMGNLDKQYNLSIAKLNAILKEKENYESQNLSLQKENDELVNHIKELNGKYQENQNTLLKLRELEKSYEVVSTKHQYLENKLTDYENLKRENEVLKSRVCEKDSFSNNLSVNYNALNEKYNSLSEELRSLSSAVLSLLPGENSAMEIIKLVGEKLIALKKIESDLEEEKIKCKNLDEECDVLNEDLKFKDVVIGDMYKDHSSKMSELKELLKKEENLRQEILLENSTLKDKIKFLDSEVNKLKTIEQSVCSSCTELKGVLQKLKMDVVDNSSKVTTLQLQIEENEITNKKKIHDYRKKISSLQEELGAALNKLEDNRLKNEVACINAYAQTESLPVQISGQSGIVQSFKIKEQEEKIQKYEKENLLLKRLCQSRLQTVQELKTKLDNVSKTQKTQRNVLEEVQNQQSS